MSDRAGCYTLSITCDRCGFRDDINDGTPQTERQAEKQFEAVGWTARNGGPELCPDCTKEMRHD